MQYEIEPITVTISNATAMTGISRSELYRLLKAEKLRAIKSGHSTLIPIDSLRQYLGSLPEAQF